METLYEDVITRAAVNVDSPEVQDIVSALEELINRCIDFDTFDCQVWRYYNREWLETINSKTRLQKCGSASERTMLWKSIQRCGNECKLIEFDYLAIFENIDKAIHIAKGDCPDCRTVEVANGNTYLQWDLFQHDYLHTVYDRIESFCDCTQDDSELIRIATLCPKCTVSRATGCLKIVKPSTIFYRDVKEREDCSIAFHWFSSAYSLFAPNISDMQLTEQIHRLVVRADIMPAFEIKETQHGINRFVVTKNCPNCEEEGWMVSHCMHESKAIRESEKHLHCFIMIKFLYGQVNYWTEGDKYLKQYHAKIAFLIHCETCAPGGQDINDCITDILKTLLNEYGGEAKTLQLPGFHFNKRLKIERKFNSAPLVGMQASISVMLRVFCEMSHYIEVTVFKNSTGHLAAECIRRIKRTVHMLLGGRLWIAKGSFPGTLHLSQHQDTISSSEILGILLKKFYMIQPMLEGGCASECKLPDFLIQPGSSKEYVKYRMYCIAKKTEQKLWTTDDDEISDPLVRKAMKLTRNTLADKPIVEYKGQRRFIYPTVSKSIRSESPRPDAHQLPPLTDPYQNDDSLFTTDLQINWSNLSAVRLGISDADVVKSSLEGCIHLRGFT